MNKLESAVIRYEKARALVRKLEGKRSELIGDCDRFVVNEDFHGMTHITGNPCGNEAYEMMISMNKEEQHGEYTDFDDAFFNYINDDEGACEKCLAAYKIKNTTLKAAKKEFGAAKRSISYFGKKLMSQL